MRVLSHYFTIQFIMQATMIQRFIHLLSYLKQPQCRIICKDPNAQMPEKGTEQAAGYDLRSAEDITIPAGERALVHTGLLIAPPKNCHVEVRPRSGLALKYGITVLNTPGTIDEDYRGEIMIILLNTSKEPFEIHIGDRIAQAVVIRHEEAIWKKVDSFETTSRGEKGFGSTGI